MSSRANPILNFSFFLCCPGTCDNGGTWMQGLCHCPLGFSGDHCELQEIRCQNGDKWDGLKCHCPSTIYGSRCEFAVEQVDLGELPEPCLCIFSWEVPLTLPGPSPMVHLLALMSFCLIPPSLPSLPCFPLLYVMLPFHPHLQEVVGTTLLPLVSFPVWPAKSCISF